MSTHTVRMVPVVHLHITYAALHWDQNLDKIVFVHCINLHEPNIIGIFWNCAWVKSAPVKSIFKNLTFLFDFKMFVCFKGGMGTRACPGSPLCLTDVSVFAEIPKVVNSLCTITVVREPGQDFKMYLASLHTRICFGSVWGRHIAQVYM